MSGATQRQVISLALALGPRSVFFRAIHSILTLFSTTMDQTLARRTLQELIKREDLKNKCCVDCGNLNPQWASLRSAPFVPFRWPSDRSPNLSFAVFICLQCAGIHRGFGVHIRWVHLCDPSRSFFLNECTPCSALSAPYRWTLGMRIKFGE